MDFKKYFELVKEKVLPKKEAVPAPEELDEDDEILRRRQPNKAMLVTGVSALAIAVMILGSLPKGDNNGTAANTRVLSGKPEMHTLSTVITGAGTLAPGDTEKVELPQVIDLDKYYVHNGDKVLAGDILASVDKVQVAAAIGKLQDVTNTLDKDLNTASSKHESTAIKSGVSGRVKAIFAQPGDDVAEVVYDNGCLMLLSLDGMMSATFPAEGSAQLGQTVEVTLSDGTVQTGRVYSVTDGRITVTISDVGAPYGDKVVIRDEAGNKLGSGTLDIHSPLQISGYYGTVAGIGVRLDQKVTSSTQLITLKDPGHTAEYTALLRRRNELSKQMDTLYAMSDGFIRATKDGIVSAIPEDAEYATAEELAEVAPVAFTDEFAGVKLDMLVAKPEYKVALLAGGSDTGGFDLMDMIKHLPEESKSTFSAVVLETDGNTATLFSLSEDATVIPYHTVSNPVNTINQFAPGTVTIEKDKLYTFTAYTLPSIPTVTEGGLYIVMASGGSGGGMPGFPGGFDYSSLLNRFSGLGSYGASTSSDKVYDTYSTDTDTIMELVPLDELTITITVDELDILQLEAGMEAAITMDAFPGTTFPGTITRVGAFGTNSGGNAKYDVKVSLHTTEQMLVGMNASLSIVTDESEELLTIPAAAIVEENGKTWVYTKYDKSKDVLTGLTEITTGLSDGQLVQILDGLSENATYYYRYADQLIYSFV